MVDLKSSILIGLSDTARSVAIGALATIASGVAVSDAATLEEAIRSEATAEPSLLIIRAATPGDLFQAVGAKNLNGRRRWAVLSLGTTVLSEPTIVSVPDGVWTSETATLFISLSLQVYTLSLEGESYRGDLKTVGRRTSHDLRAPLSAIVSAADVIRDSLKASDLGSIVFVQTITDAVSEQDRTIQRTSYLLRATTQREALTPIPMLEPLRAAMERLERRIIEAKASIELAPDWPTISGVSGYLETVWTELIANALEHSKNRPLKIELGWAKAEHHYEFFVADNGTGVPPDKYAALFYPFDQLHRLDAPRGLGLSIVQRLISLHGGVCRSEENPASGAKFYFTIPTPATKGSARSS